MVLTNLRIVEGLERWPCPYLTTSWSWLLLLGQPRLCARRRARRILSSRGIMPHGAVAEPDSMIACENRFRDNGERRWRLTETAPADSPNNVTFDGFPPKLWMLSWTWNNRWARSSTIFLLESERNI